MACGYLCAVQVVQFVLEAVRAEAFNPGTLFLFGCGLRALKSCSGAALYRVHHLGCLELYWQGSNL